MADSNVAEGRLYEPGAEVYAAAATKRQALEVWRAAETMARRSGSIARRLGFRKDSALVYEATASRFEAVSGDPSTAEDKMGGNASGIVIDELHVHKDRRLVDTLETSTAARDQPLEVIITTAGPDEEGTIYDEKRAFAEAVASGEVRNSTFWPVVYTVTAALVDEWHRLEVARLCNPGFGRSVSERYLRKQIAEAERSEGRRLTYCRLHLNYRTGTLAAWIAPHVYARAAAHLTPGREEMRGRVAYGGLDLSAVKDLTAATFLLPRWVDDPDDPTLEVEVLDVLSLAWVPLESLGERSPREEAVLRRALERGELIGIPGRVIDLDRVEADVLELADWLRIERLHIDRWGSPQVAQHLRAEGLRVFEMGQGYQSMSAPMKEVERMLFDERLRPGGNGLLRWSLSGFVASTDPAGNVKPARDKFKTRGDPWVACIMAEDAFARETRGESAYEDSDVVVA